VERAQAGAERHEAAWSSSRWRGSAGPGARVCEGGGGGKGLGGKAGAPESSSMLQLSGSFPQGTGVVQSTVSGLKSTRPSLLRSSS
jgi:hypothetical protein